jgi:ABC-2 type transport system ATP-binding protein
MSVLAVEGVTRTYGDTVALDDVSLAVDRGETVALIGPNGAGKTTLVRTATGTSTPDSGTVRLFDAAPDAVDHSRIGLLPQDFSPPDRLTAQELVGYYAGLYDEALAPGDALDAVGLTDTTTRYTNLSGGQQRRVCVACALVNDPDLLVLDEPTTGIDPAGRRSLWGLVESLTDGGTTVLLTTHDMAEAERLADRVGLLDAGRLTAMGTPAELVASHGGSPRLEVTLGAPIEGGEAALTEAGFRVERDAQRLVFHDVAATDLNDAIDALDRAGLAYESLHWTEPTLEDVYLSLADTDDEHTQVVGR